MGPGGGVRIFLFTISRNQALTGQFTLKISSIELVFTFFYHYFLKPQTVLQEGKGFLSLEVFK